MRRRKQLVGVCEAARQLGVSHTTIVRQVQAGLIPNRGTGRRKLIDVAEARELRETTLAPEKREGWKARMGARSTGTAASELQKTRLELERARALKAQLEIEQLEARLVDRASVAAAVFDAVRALREMLAALAASLAGELAAMSDPTAIRSRIDAAMRAVLAEFAEALRAKR